MILKTLQTVTSTNKPLFGFIPVYGFKNCIYDTGRNDVCNDVLQLHTKWRKDGRYNYKGLQILIHLKLNLKK